MKVKTVDIARELGISKATVSLALNGKPGVSEQTREKVLECLKRLESGEIQAEKQAAVLEPSAPVFSGVPYFPAKSANGAQIKIIYATHGFQSAFKGEIDLSTAVLQTFAVCAKKGGYSASVSANDFREISIRDIVEECSEESVKGIILHATELEPEELKIFEQISKPMVIYDNMSPESCHNCVVADNARGVRRAMEYLSERGADEIVYLAHGDDIYNFGSRRKAYLDTAREMKISGARIVPLGTATEEIYQNMKKLLETEKIAQAYLMENYQVSVGVVRALMEKGVRIPGQVSLIGIDEIPAYMTGNLRLTFVAVPHAERARMAMKMLLNEIEEENVFKSILYMDCPLHPGDSTN